MSNLFVYITNNAGLMTVASRMIDWEFFLNTTHHFYLPSTKALKDSLEKLDYPTSILISDNARIDIFIENINRIVDNYSCIFVAYHENGKLKISSQGNDCSLLYENRLSQKIPENIKSKIRCKLGWHVKFDPLYSTAVNFINGDADACQKALEAFEGDPVLHAKLNLLNLCLVPDGLNKFIYTLDGKVTINAPEEVPKSISFAIGNSGAELLDALQTAANSAKNDPFDTAYVTALNELRNNLLE